MKTIIIVILLILVVGLYFRPDITKDAMQVTGNAIKDLSESAYDKAKDINYTKVKEQLGFYLDNINQTNQTDSEE